MQTTILCPVGDRPEAIFPALREFSVDHVHMLTTPKYSKELSQLKRDLDKFGVKHSEAPLGEHLWEGTFSLVSRFAKSHPRPDSIIVHVGIGDRDMQCAATSAAFVNGLRAVNGNKDIVMGLPIMKFSYYTQLQERKLRVLKALAGGERSLNDISKEIHISLSLLSYHIHGNRKSEGLITMGLVDLHEMGGQSYVSLTAMGRLLLKGYLPENPEKA